MRFRRFQVRPENSFLRESIRNNGGNSDSVASRCKPCVRPQVQDAAFLFVCADPNDIFGQATTMPTPMKRLGQSAEGPSQAESFLSRSVRSCPLSSDMSMVGIPSSWDPTKKATEGPHWDPSGAGVRRLETSWNIEYSEYSLITCRDWTVCQRKGSNVLDHTQDVWNPGLEAMFWRCGNQAWFGSLPPCQLFLALNQMKLFTASNTTMMGFRTAELLTLAEAPAPKALTHYSWADEA